MFVDNTISTKYYFIRQTPLGKIPVNETVRFDCFGPVCPTSQGFQWILVGKNGVLKYLDGFGKPKTEIECVKLDLIDIFA